MRTTLIIFCLSIVFSSCTKIKEKKFIDARSSFVRVVIEEQVKYVTTEVVYKKLLTHRVVALLSNLKVKK